jgi:hypothetical protein
MLDKEELKNNIVFHRTFLRPNEAYAAEHPKVIKYCKGMAAHSNNYYAEKRGTTPQQAYNNNKCGKISEVFADRFLLNYGFPGGAVDYTIKNYKNKNWSSDLQYPGYPDFKFAVKSCSVKYKDENGYEQFSWVFGAGNNDGSGGIDPIVHPESKEICFFVINPNYKKMYRDSKVYIFASAPIYLIYDLFKDPLYSRYSGLKKCIYFDDLVDRIGLIDLV